MADQQTIDRIKTFLDESGCQDVKSFDLLSIGRADIADCAIVATARSKAHMEGVLSKITELSSSDGALPSLTRRKRSNWAPLEAGWEIIDLGDIVIHVMTEESREYYNLEELYNSGEML